MTPPDQQRKCRRCGGDGPRLEYEPWPGDLGQEIRSSVCDSCYRQWIEMQTRMINEYRLNVLHPEHSQAVREQMEVFLGLKENRPE